MKTKELIEEVVDNIELMKKSILAKAFCRELGINNESDGNSIEILKQILFEE